MSNYYGYVAEISIEAPSMSSNIDNLPIAHFIQELDDPSEGHWTDFGTGDDIGRLGGMLIYNNKLIVSGYSFYDNSPFAQLSHFTHSPTLNTPSFSGWSAVWQAENAGMVSGAMSHLPAAWQSLLGGQALTGNCCVSIITRTSTGPSAFAFDPDDLNVENPVPAQPLLYYTDGHGTLGTHPTLGPFAGASPTYGATTQVRGLTVIDGTRTAIFFGRNGTGPYCYGSGSACGDPTNPYSGNHAYPYDYQFWVYDMNDFAAVKAGIKEPWEEPLPSVWVRNDFLFSNDPDPKYPGGSAYDPVTKRLFVVQLGVDVIGLGSFPLVHVYKINTTSPPSVAPVATLTNNLGFNSGTSGSINTTGANLLVACVSWHATGPQPILRDSRNNSWIQAVESTDFWDYRIRLYYSVPTSVGPSHTFTVDGQGSQTSINVTAWSGAMAAPLDQTAPKGAVGTSIQPGPVTPGQGNELLISCLTNTGDSSETRTIDGGFTIAGQKGRLGEPIYATSIAGAYLVQTTAQTANPTWRYQVDNTANAVIATFKRATQ